MTMRELRAAADRPAALPHGILELYDRFEEGSSRRVGISALPKLAIITGPDLDDRGDAALPRRRGARVPDVHLGISGAFFVALTRLAPDRGARDAGRDRRRRRPA
jgi:hypothetical protein